MILSVDGLRAYITTDETDAVLEARLSGIEEAIRAYTHNRFLAPGFNREFTLDGDGTITCADDIFDAGDTVEFFHTEFNDGLHVIGERLGDGFYTVSGIRLADRGNMCLVRYPQDVVMGAVAMLRYDLEQGGNAGVASETISRHSVTYRDSSESNTLLGYPLQVSSFLRSYRRMQ